MDNRTGQTDEIPDPYLQIPAPGQRHPRAAAVERVLQAALRAADPATAVRRHLSREGNWLRIDHLRLDLRRYRRVLLLGAGKAGQAMAAAVGELLADRIHGGAVIVKGKPPTPYLNTCPRVALLPGDHPVPAAQSVRSTHHLLRWAAQATADDLILFVLSGGGSALLTAPLVPLADLQTLTRALLACGARIDEINILRRQLDQVKGGGLAEIAAPATLVTLVLSDVVGSPPEAIASGPTVPNPTCAADALRVLERYRLQQAAPPSIHAILKAQADAPPKPETAFAHVHLCLVGDNVQAARAAVAQAQAEGFHAALLTTFLQGEAREAGRLLGAILRQMALHDEPLPRPACLVAGGETTVTLHGDGLGGRNQELALAAVPLLGDLPDAWLITLATDGEDGPTDAAGALVTGDTLAQADRRHLDVADHLARNDSYHFFAALDALLRTGPTGTNVNDLAFLFTL